MNETSGLGSLDDLRFQAIAWIGAIAGKLDTTAMPMGLQQRLVDTLPIGFLGSHFALFETRRLSDFLEHVGADFGNAVRGFVVVSDGEGSHFVDAATLFAFLVFPCPSKAITG